MSLLTGLIAAGCRQAEERPQQTASATLPGEGHRPAQVTGSGWPMDVAPVVTSAPTYDSGDAALAERAQELTQREAAVAQRERDLAQRETTGTVTPLVIGPEPVAPPSAPAPRVAPHAPPTTVRVGTHARATPHTSAVTQRSRATTRTPEDSAPMTAAAVASTADSEPAAAPAPAFPRRPDRIFTNVTVPAGTSIAAEVIDGVSSANAEVGDNVTARVAQDVYAGDKVAIPAGSLVRGMVTDVHGLGRIGGRSRLAVRFDSVELPDGQTATVDATWSATGRNETARDAATIGGSTVGGAILGRILSGAHRGDRTAAGAAVGAIVGSVIAAHTHGDQVELPAGATIDLALADSVHVTARE